MIRLQLLGSLTLLREDGSSVRSVLAQPKRFALLTYLATSSGSERPRDTLLALFWPELDVEHARKALRQALYGLRKSLGTGVVTGKGAELVGVDPERLWCDAAAFSAAVEQGRDEEGLELYDGPFLEGFHLSGTPEFERWVERKRRRLRMEATSAAWRLVEAAEGKGERVEARRRAERALELAPYDGEGVRRYLSLMDRLGQPAAAIRAYEAYAERLAADLELRPSADTTDLVERIRDEEHGRASGRRGASGPAPGDGRPPRSGGPKRRPDAEVASASSRDDGPVSGLRRWSLARRGGRPLMAVVGILAFGVLASIGIAALGVGEGSGADGPQIRSLAVLPLNNYSGDPDQEYFTDGMTEALIAELGKIGALRVISRTSAMAYRNTEKSSPEIARELGADALVEGSVLKAGDKVRITLQLIHGPADRHLWSKSYERTLRDVLALQGEVARNIAREIRLTLAPETEARLAGAEEAVEPEAYEAYLKGRYRYARVTEEDHRAALSHYQKALEHDSGFAVAYAALAEVCAHPQLLGTTTTLAECRGWANRAVELAPDLAEAHAGIGRVNLAAWDWEASESAFRRAIELNPSSVMARMGYSDLLWSTKRPGQALEQIRIAEKLDPLNLFVKTAVSWPLFVQGRIEAAKEQLDGVLEMDPGFWLPIWNRGEAFVLMGKAPEALEAARHLADLPVRAAEISAHSLRVGGFTVAGEHERALEALAAFEARYGQVAPAQIALAHLQLGREEEALRWLERAFRSHDQFLPPAMVIPWSDAVRDHPRFRELERMMGLDEYPPL